MQKETIVLGEGCFWCTEAVFKMLKGVISVAPGYAEGTTANPTYEQVSSGGTGHAEVIEIEYDPVQIKLKDLLTVFFATHDPTTLNRQGADVGTQYRSVVLYTTEDQKQIVEKFITELNASNEMGEPIVTALAPLAKFYRAESYHQDYYAQNRDTNPYCQIVIDPKLEKVQRKFLQLLKSQS